MTTPNVYDYIRKLAKTDYWQTVYSLGEKTDVKLFANNLDFTKAQLIFLKYLNFYSGLFMDIALGDVTDLVLENHTYEDAYMYYKNKKDQEKFKDRGIKNSKEKMDVPGNKWIFKKLPKK